MSELEQLRLEAEQLRNQIRVCQLLFVCVLMCKHVLFMQLYDVIIMCLHDMSVTNTIIYLISNKTMMNDE